MTKQEQIEKLTAVVQRVLTKNVSKNTPSWTYDLGATEIAKALVEEENVVVLPCKVGDSVWHIQYNLTIEEAVVDNVEVLCDGDTKIRVHFVNVQAGTTFYGSAMGKCYFTSKEAAKKALEKMKK